jgi:hypothetical protein
MYYINKYKKNIIIYFKDAQVKILLGKNLRKLPYV